MSRVRVVADQSQSGGKFLEVLAALVDRATPVEFVRLHQLRRFGGRFHDCLTEPGLEVDVGWDPKSTGLGSPPE